MAKLLLNIDELAEAIGVSQSTVKRLVARGRLPRPVKLSHGVVRWPVSVLTEWAAKLV